MTLRPSPLCPPFFRHCWLAAALVLVCQGCNWTLPRGEGFNDELSTWGQTVRKQDKSDGTPLGTSSKALEIERNLGYR